MKGIILAGGVGTRLYPITKSISKQLLPIYNKPMVYYPLATLMLAGIRDILLISTPEHLPLFENLLQDGAQWGVNISYKAQPEPRGIPEAFKLGKDFIANDSVCLILGDNVFYGDNLINTLKENFGIQSGCKVFAYPVKDPQRYGVVRFDQSRQVTSIEEKPSEPKSNYAITGLYFFDNKVAELSETLKPSDRGETEITDLLKLYLSENTLKVELMGRGIAWLDTGTYESLLRASMFIETIETRQGLKIACPEEIAFRNKWIDAKQIEKLVVNYKSKDDQRYLLNLVSDL